MAKLQPKEDEDSFAVHTESEHSTENKLELYKYLLQVHSRTELTADYVLAKLTEKDKSLITDMVKHSNTATKYIDNMHRKYYKWEWNTQTNSWHKRRSNKTDALLFNLHKEIINDTYMNIPNSLAVLNRNEDKNFIIKVSNQIHRQHAQKILRS